MKERIKLLRRELNLTQAEFAEKIGAVQNTIAGYESGRRSPSNQVIILICSTFNVNEEWLRTGAGEMFAKESEDELDALTDRYGLSAADRVLIKNYLKLKPPVREAFLSFIKETAEALTEVSEELPDPGEIDIDAEVEEYRKSLERQKKVEGKSSHFDGDVAI